MCILMQFSGLRISIVIFIVFLRCMVRQREQLRRKLKDEHVEPVGSAWLERSNSHREVVILDIVEHRKVHSTDLLYS